MCLPLSPPSWRYEPVHSCRSAYNATQSAPAHPSPCWSQSQKPCTSPLPCASSETEDPFPPPPPSPAASVDPASAPESPDTDTPVPSCYAQWHWAHNMPLPIAEPSPSVPQTAPSSSRPPNPLRQSPKPLS